ncbi:MAG: transglycosylase domain-containing protein [Candidatus Paceibacterota bacterium]|jgi:membrane peptidoglycan carboxypeptidase
MKLPFLHHKEKKMKTRKKSIFFLSSLTIATFVLSIAAIGVLYFALIIRSLPSPDQFNKREVSQSTKLYDKTGKILLYEIHGEEKRTVVPFSEIPTTVKNATLAAEDANFYNQPAFDWRGILRAFYVNLSQGKITQGGSTITQQLVKQTLLTSERTISRKIKELILATELESSYSKEDIFFFYLNQIPYGSNAYGVEAASQIYFNKHVKDLTLREATILASMLKAPSYYSPWGSHTVELFDRSNYVLDRMVELKFISEKEKEEAKKQKLSFAPASLGAIIAPHFSLAVKDLLVSKYGEHTVTNGGLRVITTLDLKLQEIAERAVKEGSIRNTELYDGRNAAMVAEDPKTGQILALVGSKDYFGKKEPENCASGADCLFEGNFTVPLQGLRQPGSALKPFVYLSAFQKGFSPKTILYDVSTEFDTRNDPETSYKPGNFDNLFRGPVRMEQALAQSLNVPAVKTLYLSGLDVVLKNLHSFGITTLKERWRYGLSLTLGGGEIKLIDLLKAYSVLSQNGVVHEQVFILKVEDSDGNSIDEYHDESQRVVDSQYPRLINQILSSKELRSPVFQASLPLTMFDGYEVALKTGTTQDYRDAWTFGYTPNLAVGFWAGNNNNVAMKSRGSSILAAVPMWNAFLKEALPLFPSEPFERPDEYTLPTKPFLNGESEFVPVINGVSYPQLHTILYYIDKTNILGPVPSDPSIDYQFANWEEGIALWAKENIPNFSRYNTLLPRNIPFTQQGTKTSSIGSASVSISEPKNGVFLNSPLQIKALVSSSGDELDRVELYYNKRLINAFSISGTTYNYTYNFSLPLDPQNLFEIRATTKSGVKTSASVIVYH